MNATKAFYIENQFGPPSELVNVAQFVQSTPQVPPPVQHPPEIAEQCSVADIRDSITSVGNDAHAMAYLIKSHEYEVSSLHMAAERTARTRKRPPARDTSNDTQDTARLQSELDGVALESWKLQPTSGIFIRPVKSSDQNTLTHVKTTRTDDARLSAHTQQALLTVTVHDKLAWRQTHVSRSSQHVLLSSQTLGDLFDMIPCTSNEITEEIMDAGRVIGYRDAVPTRPGSVICIEGLAYGDGESESDYADKLIQHLQNTSKEPASLSKAPTTMHDTPLSSLSLRIGEPYWLLHHGNCEHFIVIEQIRLQHPSDPPSGYPLTLQITPPILDGCRACSKVPAVWSIMNDERLGESPCTLCGPCWTAMGDPRNDKVLAVPFPKYELGWWL
ncbi:snRNA-activating protein of 50kDa MW C terminal-domain-containing protein [Mycena alexandri]|uniref:snRNA-activating protein of 50kDa MW C terminal-domain-containing protein n=1 Tax=Mycena alexandri TaxID=1745969 RepID=A0AAD6TI27_9AGAR|nr:snRNA-activating protein of 50kDa MW C terminal-domain-containing protein [Mycena alexandri]